MTPTRAHLGLLALTGAAFAAISPSAHAMTMKECGASYQAAKSAGTLAGMDWHTYQTTKCSATAAATPVATAPAVAPGTPVSPMAPVPPPAAAMKPVATKPAAVAVAPAAAGNAVFPDKVDPKYASLTAGKQRFKTCDDQYKANKATNGNGGMKWIQKGGGYYSLCSKHLKG